MVTRIGGQRRKSRHKMLKKSNRKGKISVQQYFQKFNNGDKVRLMAEPAVQKALYFPRYHNKIGVVLCAQGKCYKVEIMDFKKPKTIIVHPVHLRRA